MTEPYIFPGPPPNDIKQNAGIFQLAQSALKINSLTPELVEKLLPEIVARARAELSIKARIPKFSEAASELKNTCGQAQAIVANIAESVGITVQRLQVNDFFTPPPPVIPHEFNVLLLPVTQDGKTEVKPYLVDITLRQFFTPNDHSMNIQWGPNHPLLTVPMPGVMLTATDEGQAFANAVLAKGFIELNEADATRYLSSFASGDLKKGKMPFLRNLMDRAYNQGPSENYSLQLH